MFYASCYVMKILPSITTTQGADFRWQIEEIKELEIKEVALFPTVLGLDARRELYKALDELKNIKIPHIHLRTDMEDWELDMFVQKYEAQVFNINHEWAFGLLGRSKYRNMIYIENRYGFNEEFFKCLGISAGLCLDFSHWEDFGAIQNLPGYENFEDLCAKHKIGCCHVSGVFDDYIIDSRGYKGYSRHRFEDLSQFDYMKKYVKYLPEYVSIELSETIHRQLEVKEYLEKKIINI